MVSASGVKPPAALDFDMKVFNNEKISLAGYDEKQNEGGSLLAMGWEWDENREE
ncbi:unnamed protein product [Rhodiola kirilowii]